MSLLPSSLYTASQVQALDRRAIDEFGIPGYELMCRAGAAAQDVLREHWPGAQKIVVLCGSGNNGGDGYVLARLAREVGMDVILVSLADTSHLSGDARKAHDDWCDIGGEVCSYSGQLFEGREVIVDGLLGTGLEREVEGEWRSAIEAVNRSGIPVLALDIPSGLQADSGMVLGAAVAATATISFIGLKRGLFTGQGVDCCGMVHFHDLDVPEGVYAGSAPVADLLQRKLLKHCLPRRPRSNHKGNHGHVLVIGGDYGFSGAARMAGEAAARAGAGLVSLATRTEHAAIIAAARPELMCHGVEDSGQLQPLLQKATVVVIGPGLGQSPWAQRLLSYVLESGKPLVVDADALNLLAQEPLARGNWVLTPHPGEAARLLKTELPLIQQDRFSALDALVDAYQGVCVLKGPGTLIGSAEGMVSLCDGGNPGMASGGMGDVLSGVIAALIAQGLGLEDAARCGVYVHAAAADAAAVEGERGMLAGDLMDQLRWLVNPV